MIDSATLHMRRVRCLSEDRGVRGFVLDRFRAAQAEGHIPPRPLPRNDDAVVVALDGETFAGFATYHPTDDNRLWLDVLWVEPGHRRRGIATRLLDEVERAARLGKCRGVCLGHEPYNAAMAALMQRTGWEIDHIVCGIGLRP